MIKYNVNLALNAYESSNFLGYGMRKVGKTELFFSGSKSLFDLTLREIFDMKSPLQ